MAFEKYSTEKLKKYNKLLLTIAVIGLGVMCFALGMGIYRMSHDLETNLFLLVPTIFAPLCLIPALLSASIGSELKKRKS